MTADDVARCWIAGAHRAPLQWRKRGRAAGQLRRPEVRMCLQRRDKFLRPDKQSVGPIILALSIAQERMQVFGGWSLKNFLSVLLRRDYLQTGMIPHGVTLPWQADREGW